MNDKPGILILTPFYEPNLGGVETHLKDLTEYLKKYHKYSVYVLTYQPITTDAKGAYFERDGNIRIIRVPWIGFNLFHKLEPYPLLEFLYITPWLLMCTFIFLLFKGQTIETIHAQGFNASFVARVLKIIFRKRFIASTHAIYELNPRSIMAKIVKWTLSPADKILALSKPSKNELVRLGLAEDKVGVYCYWVDQKLFQPSDKESAKKQLDLNGKFVVLFVGRFIKIKGTDVLLEVANQVGKNICFAFIGDGPMADEIKKASMGIDNVIFIGKINNLDLPLYYNAADILCIPSQYEEGFGRVILEALSCGTPVIGSNKGGIPEAIDSNVGVLVEPNVESIKRAIELLYQDRGKLKVLTQNSRDYAVKRFDERNALIIERNYWESVRDGA